jgi:hypothetical protein
VVGEAVADHLDERAADVAAVEPYPAEQVSMRRLDVSMIEVAGEDARQVDVVAERVGEVGVIDP